MKTNLPTRLLIAAAALLLMAPQAPAMIVQNNLTGNVQYDGWDDLAGVPGYGFGTDWSTPLGSFEDGSGDAALDRTSGFHFSASASLYSFSGESTFSVFDSSAISGVETIVLTIVEWENPDFANIDPVLNFNGGTQGLAADYVTVATDVSTIDFGGEDIDINATTYQWDVSALGAISSFSLDWEQAVHSGITAIQLEQSDVFTVASATVVPEPATGMALLAAGAAMLGIRRRRRSA